MTDMSFLNPEEKYRGTDLWMLNDRLEDHELARQMDEMKKAGCGAFIARTFIGLISDYPGEDYLDRMTAIITKAKETGQKVFLQAGYMPGGVAHLPEEFTHTVLKEINARDYCEKDGQVIAEHSGIKYCISPKENCLDLLNPKAMKYYMQIAYTDIWDRFKDEFGKTIVSVWVDEPHFNPPHLPWTAELPELFEKTWGYKIEDKIQSLFCHTDDYGSIRYHYWRVVLMLLKNAYFEEVSRWCREHNLKFSGHLMGEDALKMQIGFTCSIMPLYKYMDIPGIDFLTADTTWAHGLTAGIDNCRSVMTPLQCTGAAHQAGKSDILCEMYGVSTQGLTFSDQRYFMDYFAALGITHRCVHGIFYSLRGRRKRMYVPHFSYYQPWWTEYKAVTDYCGRVSWFMRQGKPVADVLVLHPVEAAFMEYESADMANVYGKCEEELRNAASKLDRMNLQFKVLLNDMLGMQCSFELGDEDTLADWGKALDGGLLKVGHMTYKTVVLPNLHVIRESTYSILKQFMAKGGRVVAMGSAPGRIDGKPDYRCGSIDGIRIVDGIDGLKSYLKEACPCEYIFESDDDCSCIWINIRDTEGGRSVFIFNTDRNRGRKGVLKFRGRFSAEEWLGESGEVENMAVGEENGCTIVDTYLKAGGSRMIALKKFAINEAVYDEADNRGVFYAADKRCIHIGGKWDIKRKNPNAMPLEFCSYKKGDGEYSSILPVLAVQQILCEEDYKGPVTLRFEISAAYIPEDVRLVLEEPDEYSLAINGIKLSINKTGMHYLEKNFEIIDISGALKKGTNIIEVTRYFEPLQKASTTLTELFQSLGGVELESLYLIGSFGLYASTEPTNTGCIRFNRNFRMGMEKTEAGRELTMEGYPFYAGTVVLEKTLTVDDVNEDEKAVLKVCDFRGCVGNVYINDSYAGKLCWEPYEVDVTGKLVKGGNKIRIELTNTLRNLLGPYHRPEGELPHCWREYPWTGDFDHRSAVRHPEWYKDRVPDTVTWTESYLQVPFGIDSVVLYFLERYHA
jgi:hypothetical protein